VYLRIILIGVLIFLVVRMIKQFFNGGGGGGPTINKSSEGKKVSDDTGEYIDYEEVK
jgi:hypothetical protein